MSFLPGKKLYSIAAVSENLVIGKGNEIPWRIKGDLPRFKHLTMGHPVIMGRKTLESMGKFGPLPNRFNIILTSRDEIDVNGLGTLTHDQGPVPLDTGGKIALARSIEEALTLTGKAYEVYFIGGERVYAEAMEMVDVLRITHVHREVEDGDAFFPQIDSEVWVPSYEDPQGTHTYVDYVRRVPVVPA